jgi:hypothetical protein
MRCVRCGHDYWTLGGGGARGLAAEEYGSSGGACNDECQWLFVVCKK